MQLEANSKINLFDFLQKYKKLILWIEQRFLPLPSKNIRIKLFKKTRCKFSELYYNLYKNIGVYLEIIINFLKNSQLRYGDLFKMIFLKVNKNDKKKYYNTKNPLNKNRNFYQKKYYNIKNSLNKNRNFHKKKYYNKKISLNKITDFF